MLNFKLEPFYGNGLLYSLFNPTRFKDQFNRNDLEEHCDVKIYLRLM